MMRNVFLELSNDAECIFWNFQMIQNVFLELSNDAECIPGTFK